MGAHAGGGSGLDAEAFPMVPEAYHASSSLKLFCPISSLCVMWSVCYFTSVGFFRFSVGKGTTLRRTRIAAAMGIAVLAAAGSLFTSSTARASTSGAAYTYYTYVCPEYINDDGTLGLYESFTGQGYLICIYAPPTYPECRYNAYNGTPTSPTGAPLNNPSYCPEDAVAVPVTT